MEISDFKYWYKRTDKRSSFCMNVAQRFYVELARDLGVTPVPIHWQERTQKDCTLATGYQFEWGGWTPHDPCHIEIVCTLSERKILESIAHECFHLYQDTRSGRGWRQQNTQDCEAEAYAFQKSPDVVRRIDALLA
jgi:hypothetical protein